MWNKLVSLVFVLLLTPMAFADSRGEQLIRAMDQAFVKAQDQILDQEMIIQDKPGSPRKLLLRVHVRGEKRHIEFLSPGDVKGLKLLIRSRDQMYLYLPAYRKVRRIASHMRDQTILGSDYNFDEMSTAKYSEIYKAELVKETLEHYHVRGTQRPGKVTPYARVEFWIRKREQLPDKIEYFNDKGKKIKSETRTEYTCPKDVCGARVMRMVDHTRNDHWTEIIRTKWQINTGFSDRKFKRRELQR